MKLVKKIIPDLIKNYINTILKRRIILKNNYSSWNSALKNSNGYNYYLIFQETKKSFEKVISQKAKFERDSVLFYESDPDKKLISIIKRLYKKNTINICDIGGSLGSLYFQNIDFLDKKKIIWKIVEQKHYVKYANKNINIKNLKFYCSVNSVLKNKVDLVIFSSVLQYLEFPSLFVIFD